MTRTISNRLAAVCFACMIVLLMPWLWLFHHGSSFEEGIAAWLITASLGILAVTGGRLLLKRTSSPGHCGQCGYDLRRSDGDVCPECGKARALPPRIGAWRGVVGVISFIAGLGLLAACLIFLPMLTPGTWA